MRVRFDREVGVPVLRVEQHPRYLAIRRGRLVRVRVGVRGYGLRVRGSVRGARLALVL